MFLYHSIQNPLVKSFHQVYYILKDLGYHYTANSKAKPYPYPSIEKSAKYIRISSNGKRIYYGKNISQEKEYYKFKTEDYEKEIKLQIALFKL